MISSFKGEGYAYRVPGCNSWWATQKYTNLVRPTCTFLYIVLCLASSVKWWTKQKKGTKTTLLALMGFHQSAYLVMASSHISNGHCRKWQISMEEQTSYTLEPAPGVWGAGPVFFLSLIPFTVPSNISTLSDESASWVILLEASGKDEAWLVLLMPWWCERALLVISSSPEFSFWCEMVLGLEGPLWRHKCMPH